MTEREALLRAVCENPDDDTPRLVFADWLEENGDAARAEFIRKQCRLAQASFATHDEQVQLLLRTFELFKQNEDLWMSELPEYNSPAIDWGGMFERGFAGEMLTVRAVLKVSPDSTRVEYTETDCSFLDWERIFQLTPFTRLMLCNLSRWTAPLRQAQSCRLKSVCLSECEIDDDSLQVLLAWCQFSAGHLLIRQETLNVEWDERLRFGFGERFRRKSAFD